MSSKVYMIDLSARSHKENKMAKLQKLFDAVGMGDCIKEKDLTAVKIHFGEVGSDAFIQPIFVKPIVDKVKEAGGNPFLTDTNTLYAGMRHNAVDHLNTAAAHGFVPSVVGAPVVIADGLRGDNYNNVEINQKHFKEVKIAGDIERANSMIVMSHFKGHEMAGFGGAVKNLAMGCAPSLGKKDQHSTRPFVKAKHCVTCGRCHEICPVEAISYVDEKAFIDQDVCIGCGDCLAVCPTKAVVLNWKTELVDFMERMTEYALGAVKNKTGRVAYINFLMRVTPDCDCCAWSDAPLVKDIGILASDDPVAIDQACKDLVNAQRPLPETRLTKEHGSDHEYGDIFKAVHPHTLGDIQLDYGQEIGLGSKDYELIKL